MPSLRCIVTGQVDEAGRERPEGPAVAERLAAARVFNPDATEYEVGWKAGWDQAKASRERDIPQVSDVWAPPQYVQDEVNAWHARTYPPTEEKP